MQSSWQNCKRLRDRLVCGVRDVRVQRNLLAKPDLNFETAFKLAQAAEVAEREGPTEVACTSRTSPHCRSSKVDKTGVTAASTSQTPVVSRTQSAIIVTKRDISPRSAVPRQKRNNIRNDELVRTGSRVRKTFCKGRKVGPTPPTLCLRWKI